MPLTLVDTASTPEPTEEVADFLSVRSRLFGIAYRTLGRVEEAEDVVQDVWVRWQGADRARVHDRIAFLVTITTRVALNVAVSARARREVCVDRWFPERVLAPEDPTLAVERSEDLERAVLLLLQRLSPTERAVFVLREAFDHSFREIAEALGISEANARQIGRRARANLAGPRRAPVRPATRDRLLSAFLDAARVGAVADLERLLAEDALATRSTSRTVVEERPQRSARLDSGVPSRVFDGSDEQWPSQARPRRPGLPAGSSAAATGARPRSSGPRRSCCPSTATRG